MADLTPQRDSALQGHLQTGHFGHAAAGVTISEVRDLHLWQLAVWSDTLDAEASGVAQAIGVDGVPGFGAVTGDSRRAMLRIEPLKFWVFGAALQRESQQSAVLDLSHSRTHLRLGGEHARTVLNSFIPVDLRAEAFPQNRVISSAMHHVGVTLWHSDDGIELFVPRGFALSVWELLVETSLQYGLTVS
jgi:heterotetrameric sarcosine oxidase gamma subunit